VSSLSGRQNSNATPHPFEDEFTPGEDFRIALILNTLAKPEILPPNSSCPDVGGIDKSTLSRLPGSNPSAVVSKYKPLELTLTVRPDCNSSIGEPTLLHDNSNFAPSRRYLRFSDPSILSLPAKFYTVHNPCKFT
jgi:hypothetical protein